MGGQASKVGPDVIDGDEDAVAVPQPSTVNAAAGVMSRLGGALQVNRMMRMAGGAAGNVMEALHLGSAAASSSEAPAAAKRGLETEYSRKVLSDVPKNVFGPGHAFSPDAYREVYMSPLPPDNWLLEFGKLPSREASEACMETYLYFQGKMGLLMHKVDQVRRARARAASAAPAHALLLDAARCLLHAALRPVPCADCRCRGGCPQFGDYDEQHDLFYAIHELTQMLFDLPYLRIWDYDADAKAMVIAYGSGAHHKFNGVVIPMVGSLPGELVVRSKGKLDVEPFLVRDATGDNRFGSWQMQEMSKSGAPKIGSILCAPPPRAHTVPSPRCAPCAGHH